MADLSPAAHAMVVAVTQAQYGLDPEDVENETARIRYELAAALRALVDQVVPEGRALMIRMPEADVSGNELGGMLLTAEPNDRIRDDILAIARELEGRADA